MAAAGVLDLTLLSCIDAGILSAVTTARCEGNAGDGKDDEVSRRPFRRSAVSVGPADVEISRRTRAGSVRSRRENMVAYSP